MDSDQVSYTHTENKCTEHAHISTERYEHLMVMCVPNSEMYLIVWCIGCVLYLDYHTKVECAMCNMVPELWGRGRGMLLLFLSREKTFANCVIPVHHTP